jgi:hypothetical protein
MCVLAMQDAWQMVSSIAQASSVFTPVLGFLTCFTPVLGVLTCFTPVLGFLTCFIHNLVSSAVVLSGVLCMKVSRQPYMR